MNDFLPNPGQTPYPPSPENTTSEYPGRGYSPNGLYIPPQGPVSELIRARCTQGKLVVTTQSVRVEQPYQLQSQTMARASIASVDYKLAVSSLFGLGGGANLVFHGQGGERLHANLVNPKVAKQIIRLLGY
jgi:hypothetical protein